MYWRPHDSHSTGFWGGVGGECCVEVAVVSWVLSDEVKLDKVTRLSHELGLLLRGNVFRESMFSLLFLRQRLSGGLDSAAMRC